MKNVRRKPLHRLLVTNVERRSQDPANCRNCEKRLRRLAGTQLYPNGLFRSRLSGRRFGGPLTRRERPWTLVPAVSGMRFELSKNECTVCGRKRQHLEPGAQSIIRWNQHPEITVESESRLGGIQAFASVQASAKMLIHSTRLPDLLDTPLELR